MENKSYSLLIIALYCYSGHVKAVIDHLKAANPLVEITLLTEKADELQESLEDKSIRIERYDVAPVKIKWRWLMNEVIRYKQCKFFSKFSLGRRYDIVNVHFPNMFMASVYKGLRTMGNRLVITPWGSDILRRDEKYLKRLTGLYKRADYIATSNKTSLGRRIIEEMGIEPTKLVGNFFGSDVVDYALKNGAPISTEDAKKRYDLSGRYVITCGYNQREAQRHKSIIAAIDQVRDRLPENTTLLFPMTYGFNTDAKYVEECKKECEERNLPSVFITSFLSVEDLFLLRKATDMFVHVQTTDASSGSLKEYILCDKKIVHGAWIKYPDLERFSPLFYFPVEELDELGEVIVHAYHSDKIAIPKEVKDFVYSGGWEQKAARMNDFFMSIL